MVGRNISHYKIVARLGEGGMGVVYKAEDTRLQRPVALKFLRLNELSGEEEKARFLREARAAAALDHPNICTVYEVDEADGQPFISMAFLQGETVEQKIQSSPLNIDDALDYAMQAAKGLAAAHEKGIVHRDIKSANLLVTRPSSGHEPVLKIMDFGLAQLADSRLTREGTTLGTAAYMSPEQASGEKVDQRTDLWALGVVIYEMLTGQLPFPGDYQQAVIYAILNESPPPLTALRSGVGLELERIVNKALAKDPEERYQSATDMLVDLRTLRKQRDSAASQIRYSSQMTRLTSAGAAATPAASQVVPPEALAQEGPAPPASTKERGVPAGRSRILRYTLYASAAVILVLAGVIGSRFLPGPRGRPRIEALQVKPLTTYAGTEAFPTFSPGGNQVAFAWDGETHDNFDIYVRLVEGGRPVRLTTDPAVDTSPVWSPDNRYIAFLRRARGATALYVVPPIGGTERKLAELRTGRRLERFRNLAWTPDGRSLAFVERGSPGQPGGLVLLSIETGERRPLLTSNVPGPGVHSPAFSPDGRRLAFVRPMSPFSGDIFVATLEDQTVLEEPEQLTFDEQEIHGLTWGGDGRGIVFASNRGGNPGLWRIRARGGEPRRLPLGGDVRSPAAAHQANRLAYTQAAYDVNIWRRNLPDSEEASAPVKLIASTRQEEEPQFSPDGRRIVFHSDRSGSDEIWVCDADGTNAVQLTFLGSARVDGPRWSPDGRQIVFQAGIGSNGGLYVVSVDGGSPWRLSASETNRHSPTWSRDGRWIYFTEGRSGAWKVPAEPPEGERPEPILVTEEGGFAQESIDGGFVYVVRGDPRARQWSLGKVAVGGGEFTPLPEAVKLSSPNHWFVAKQGIYFSDAQGTIQLFEPATQLTIAVATLEETARGRGPSAFAVSPDGRSILYTRQDRAEADLMLVENFH